MRFWRCCPPHRVVNEKIFLVWLCNVFTPCFTSKSNPFSELKTFTTSNWRKKNQLSPKTEAQVQCTSCRPTKYFFIIHLSSCHARAGVSIVMELNGMLDVNHRKTTRNKKSHKERRNGEKRGDCSAFMEYNCECDDDGGPWSGPSGCLFRTGSWLVALTGKMMLERNLCNH